MSNDPSFSIYDFRKWLSDQSPNVKMEKKSNSVPQDITVECRLGLTRLEMQMKKHNPELTNIETLAQEFKEDGASVKEDDGINLMLETSSGKFKLPKLYTKAH